MLNRNFNFLVFIKKNLCKKIKIIFKILDISNKILQKLLRIEKNLLYLIYLRFPFLLVFIPILYRIHHFIYLFFYFN
jgi:hypothetical protein